MDIKTAKKLDYILKVISDEINKNFNFEVVWRDSCLGMFTADLTIFENAFPIEEKMVNNYIQKEHLNANFLPLKEAFFKKFALSGRDPFALEDFNNSIEDNPSAVFKSLIAFVENDNNNNIPFDDAIYNVELLNLSKKFEFILISKDETLSPVSLLVTPKN